jgi:SAM-dependent methyltransferase
VSPLWHGLATILLDEPRALASPGVLRMLLTGEGSAGLVYAGDRMWPAIRHGQAISVRPASAADLAAGDVVLALVAGVPDVLRIVGTTGSLRANADADPADPITLPPESVLGRVDAVASRGWIRGRPARALLDWVEAVGGVPDEASDPADTVLEKYEDQAAFYARSEAVPLEPALRRSIAERVPAGARVLIAGCGTGREAFAVEAIGFRPFGIDFSPRMIAIARAEGARRVPKATFDVSDLRSHVEPAGSLGAILFTYDVYSFLPSRAVRTALLARLRAWLAPGGVLFLSARRARGATERALLGLQRCASALRGGGGEWGDSHTRRIDAAGRIRRSFIHLFTPRSLSAETTAAGFQCAEWSGGHGAYVAAPGLSPSGRA